MSQLLVDNVTKEFPTRSDPLKVLQGISLQLTYGENIGILGPSGSGKSTLLHIIGTLENPTSGSLTLNDMDPFALSEPELAEFRRRQVGFIFQDHHLLPQLSVLENVLVPALASGRIDQTLVDRAKGLLERVGLSERADHRPAELSGGERQRTAVARAVIHRPALLLADEPTGSLDRGNAMAIGKLLVDIQSNEQTMLIVVTHSQEMASLLQRQTELIDGKLSGI